MTAARPWTPWEYPAQKWLVHTAGAGCRLVFEEAHHIFSLVGDQSAGKSYYLSVLTQVLPATLFNDFGVTMQDADPTGNAPLNEMRKSLFSAQSSEQIKVEKTKMEGDMYERLPRQGRVVALPRPFISRTWAGTPREPDVAPLSFTTMPGSISTRHE